MAWRQAQAIVRARLPERRIVVVGHDGQRTFRVGTGVQAMAIGGAALVAGWLSVATATMVAAPADQQLAAKQAELRRMAAQVEALKADTSALKGQVATTAQRIEQRQAFLAGLLSGKADAVQLAALLPKAADSAATAVDAGIIEPFRRLEAKQLAFVDKAAATAETRLKDTEALIRRLGLDPARFVAQTAFAGQGGPFVPATAQGADPRFAELFVNWKRVEQLEQGLTALPAYVPVKTFTYTSHFGVRYDPFHGGAAMHTGLDMAGSMGEPVYASAAGTVVRAGRFGAYGNCIDVDHGKGIITRYGHLSRIAVEVGDRVEMGARIGAMGSTGRSTGTHLHFEVRIDGRAVDPRPFLDASQYVLAMQGERTGRVGPQIASVE